MAAIKQLFEKELKNKLALKSSGHVSEETVLVKAFKYFDLDNSGFCSKEEFLRTINKIGVTGFSDKNLLDVFDLYDVDGSGELDYKEFVGGVYGNNSISRKSDVQAKVEVVQQENKGSKKVFLEQAEIQSILERIRNKLVARGVRGIVSIGRAFRIMDDDNSRTLDIFEFKKAAKDYRFDLSDVEVEKAFLAFDVRNTGRIDYEEFLRTVRGNMNAFRRKLVDQAFNIIDKDRSGQLDINDIKGTYNAKFHPEVKAGKKTEEEVLLEFLETFEHHHNLVAGESADHVVTKDEWVEYYENISMSIDDDAYFELMMNNCWRMNNNTTSNNEKKGWSNKEESGNNNANVQDSYKKKFGEERKVSNEVEQPKTLGNPLLDKFRDRLLARGGRGIIGLARQFKIFDDNNSKSLDFDEFAKAVRDFKIELSPNEVKVVFGLFDRDGQGSVDYEEFLRTVRGEMNEKRRNLALQAFNKMDKDGSGILDINDIKYVYSVKHHPDFKSKKKTEEELFGEFLETFETHHNINRGPRDRRVTKEEWIEYYNNISMSIDSDDYFEQMMVAAWRLGPQVEVRHPWKSVEPENYLPKCAERGGKYVPKNVQVFKNAPFGVTSEATAYGNPDKPGAVPFVNTFSKKGDETLLKFREKLASRGTRGIMGIRRSFKIADDDNSRQINFDEFSKLIKDYRISINDVEIKKLFAIFDSDKSGQISYDEFLRGVVGEMNDGRKELVKKAFVKLDKTGNGLVDLEDIRGVYNARNHPDVKSGRKKEDEVLAEFLDTFEYHFQFLNDNQSRDRSITLDEFVEYYNNISMSIDDDRYFELMINNAWNLDGTRGNYQKAWKQEL